MKRFLLVALLFPLACCASITSTTDKTGPFTITGLPQTIPVGFPFQQTSDLVVLDEGASGQVRDPAVVLTLGSDYTVTGGGYNGSNQMQTGSIVVVSTGTNAVLTNDVLVLMRGVSPNQTINFSATGALTITLLEQMGDKLATLSQQVNEIGGRALQFEPQEFLSPTLDKVARENQLLGFDANGNISYYPSPGSGGGSIVSVSGTTNQISASTTNGAVALSLPSTIIAPGSLTTTTSLTVGTTVILSSYTTAGLLQNDASGNVTTAGWKTVSTNTLQTPGGAQFQDVGGGGALALVANGSSNGITFEAQSGGQILNKVGGTTYSTLTSTLYSIQVPFAQIIASGNIIDEIGQSSTDNLYFEWVNSGGATIGTYFQSEPITIVAQGFMVDTSAGNGQLVVGGNGDTFVGGGSDPGATFGVNGNAIVTGSITTGAGVTTAAEPWNLGEVRTSTGLSVSTTTGVQVGVNGVKYTLAVLTTNP